MVAPGRLRTVVIERHEVQGDKNMASISIDGGSGHVDRLSAVSTSLDAATSELTFESHLNPPRREGPSESEPPENREPDSAEDSRSDSVANETEPERAETETGEESPRSEGDDAGDSNAQDANEADASDEEGEEQNEQEVVVTVSTEVLDVPPEATDVVVVERDVEAGEELLKAAGEEGEQQEVSLRSAERTVATPDQAAEQSEPDAPLPDQASDLPDQLETETAASADGEKGRRRETAQPVNAPKEAAPTTTAPADQVALPSIGAANDGDGGESERRSPQPQQQPQTGLAVNSSQESADAAAPRFSDQLLLRSTGQADRTIQLDSVQQARFIDRVARAVQAAEGRGEPIRLRLHPPELGALKLELRVQKGALTARLETETAAARAILVENLPVLRDRLVEQGVRIDQFEVDLGGAPSGAEREADQDANQSQDSASSGPGTSDEVDESPLSTPVGRSTGDDQIDIVV